MEFRYQPPPGWPRSVPPPGSIPGVGWPLAPEGWDFWWEERPRQVGLGVGLDVAVFLTVWLVTLGFARLDLTMFAAASRAAWSWLWIAGAGLGLTGAILAASPRRRSFGLGILVGLPIPVLLAYFLTA